jgi:hypothetical protein
VRGGGKDAARAPRLRGLLAGTPGLVLGLALVLGDLVLLNLAVSRHPLRLDWTRGNSHTLSPKTLRVLEGLGRRVEVTLVDAPATEEAAAAHAELVELIRGLARRSPLVAAHEVDLDADPTGATLLAQRHAVGSEDLREGIVIVEAGPRSAVVRVPTLSEHRVTADGSRRRVAFRGEAILLGALLGVTASTPPAVCFTRDHGEAPVDSFEEAGFALIAAEVARDGYLVRALPSEELVRGAAGCRVVVVGGPTRSFAPVELDALDRLLRHDGRLFVLEGPILDRRVTRYGRTGLEALLATWGVELPDNVLLDKFSTPGDRPPMTWATRDGYGDHPVVRDLRGRITVWPLAREVRPRAAARPNLSATTLVQTSREGWGETDLAALREGKPTFDPEVDSRGPVSAAVAVSSGATRIVVLGTERGVLNRRLREAASRDYNRELFLAALAWLSGEERLLGIGPKVPELERVALDDAQLRLVFLIVVVGLPAIPLCIAALVAWRRRR